MTDAADGLATLCSWEKLPPPVREFRAIPGRRFRWDLAWPDRRLLMEVDGGGFISGRHSRGKGMESDAEKQSLAVVAGYRVLRCTPRHIEDGSAVRWIREALA